MNSQHLRKFTLLVIITLLQVGATSFSFFLITHNKGLIIWLPSGFALVILILFGLRFWPCIALGIFIASIFAGLPLVSVLGMVLSIIMAALTTVYLLLRLNFHSTLEHTRDLFLLLMGSILYSIIGSSIALIGQSIGGVISWSAFGNQLIIMGIGDITSTVVIAPILLVWRRTWDLNFRKCGWRLLEAALFSITLVGCILCFLVRDFRAVEDFYIFFPLLIWAGLRFGRHGATGAIFLVLLCLTGVYSSRFAVDAHPIKDLLALEISICTVVVMTLILAVTVSERRQAERKLQELNDHLEQHVGERTQALIMEIAERRRIEEALRESEEKYRSIVENSVDGILLLDSESYICEWNRGLENINGLKKNNVIGKRIWEINLQIIGDEMGVKENYGSYQAYIRKIFKGEISVSGRPVKIFVEHSDGTRHMIQLAIFLIESQRKLLLCAIIRDITEQQKLADEIIKYAQRLEVLHEIDRSILESRSINQLIDTVLPNLQGFVGCQIVNFIAFDKVSNELACFGTDIGRQTKDELASHFGIGLDQIPFQLTEGEFILINDLQSWPIITPVFKILLSRGIRTLLSVPLLLQDEFNGAILLGAEKPNAFDHEQIDIAREVANEIAVAIQQARLIEQIRAGREELRQLAQRVVEVQEEERRSLSRELHDEAGQALTALKISLELITKELPVELHSVRNRLIEAVTLTDATMEELRSLARGLRPSALDTVGLNYTLEDFCRDFAKRSKIAVEYSGENLPSLSDAENICLYRIIQESLTNVYKHAQAHHIKVTLCQESEAIALTIQDYGRGFQQMDNKRVKSKGIGLLGMEERLTALGGKLIIHSEIGQGTQIIARIPRKESGG